MQVYNNRVAHAVNERLCQRSAQSRKDVLLKKLGPHIVFFLSLQPACTQPPSGHDWVMSHLFLQYVKIASLDLQILTALINMQMFPCVIIPPTDTYNSEISTRHCKVKVVSAMQRKESATLYSSSSCFPSDFVAVVQRTLTLVSVYCYGSFCSLVDIPRLQPTPFSSLNFSHTKWNRRCIPCYVGAHFFYITIN